MERQVLRPKMTRTWLINTDHVDVRVSDYHFPDDGDFLFYLYGNDDVVIVLGREEDEKPRGLLLMGTMMAIYDRWQEAFATSAELPWAIGNHVLRCVVVVLPGDNLVAARMLDVSGDEAQFDQDKFEELGECELVQIAMEAWKGDDLGEDYEVVDCRLGL